MGKARMSVDGPVAKRTLCQVVTYLVVKLEKSLVSIPPNLLRGRCWSLQLILTPLLPTAHPCSWPLLGAKTQGANDHVSVVLTITVGGLP